MGLQYGVKIVRDTFERALTSVGLHVAKGAILWEAYREFENVMLGMLQVRYYKRRGMKRKWCIMTPIL